MRLAYHPQVQLDVNRIVRHYDRISARLGDEFWNELMRLVELVSSKPQRFHFAQKGLRRANMRRFPYHLLFRETQDTVRIIVLRHNRRRPSFGTSRQSS
jgi:toxin ParE1/3/4